MNLQIISTTQIQRNLSSILNYLEEPVVVVRDSKPEAVLMPYDDYTQLAKESRVELARRIKQSLAGIRSEFASTSEKNLNRLIEQAKIYARHRRRH